MIRIGAQVHVRRKVRPVLSNFTPSPESIGEVIGFWTQDGRHDATEPDLALPYPYIVLIEGRRLILAESEIEVFS